MRRSRYALPSPDFLTPTPTYVTCFRNARKNRGGRQGSVQRRANASCTGSQKSRSLTHSRPSEASDLVETSHAEWPSIVPVDCHYFAVRGNHNPRFPHKHKNRDRERFGSVRTEQKKANRKWSVRSGPSPFCFRSWRNHPQRMKAPWARNSTATYTSGDYFFDNDIFQIYFRESAEDYMHSICYTCTVNSITESFLFS